MTESLILCTERQEHIAFFDISGYINNTGGKQIADTCNDLIAEGIHHFIFDLNRVPPSIASASRSLSN